MRCAACNVILSHSEMASDKEDGSINDICYTCAPYINDPDFCMDREYQMQDITGLMFKQEVTQPKPVDTDWGHSRRPQNYYV